ASDQRGWRCTPGAGAAAVSACLCFATRTAGVVLLPCLLVSAIPRAGEVRRKAVFAAALAVVLMGVHSLVFRGAGSYLEQLRAPWHALPHQLKAYGWNVRHVFFGIENRVFGTVFLFVVAGLGCAGFAIRLRRGVSVSEVFTLCYALLILLWSSDEDLRLLKPLLPMWLLYVGVALRSLSGRSERLAGVALLAIAIGGYASRYSAASFGPIGQGVGDPAFTRVCG